MARESFQQFLNSNPEIKKEFLKKLKDPTIEIQEISKYLTDKGYPNNPKSLSAFISKNYANIKADRPRGGAIGDYGSERYVYGKQMAADNLGPIVKRAIKENNPALLKSKITGTGKKTTGLLNAAQVGEFKAMLNNPVLLKDFANRTGINANSLRKILTERGAAVEIERQKGVQSGKLKSPTLKPQVDIYNTLLKGPVRSIDVLSEKIGLSKKDTNKGLERLLRNIYAERVSMGKGSNASKGASIFISRDDKVIDDMLGKLHNIDGFKKKAQYQFSGLLYDAYGRKSSPTYSPKKYTKAMANYRDYFKIKKVAEKYGIKLELDHPLSRQAITNANLSADKMVKVTPISERLNTGLKQNLDRALLNNPSKRIQIVNLANNLGVKVGSITDTGVARVGVRPFDQYTSKTLIDDVIGNLKSESELASRIKSLDPKLIEKAGMQNYQLNAPSKVLDSKQLGSLKNAMINAVKKLSKKEQLDYCSLLSRGGLPGDCAAAIKNNTVQAAQVFDQAPATSSAMTKVKNAATTFLKFAGKGKVFGATAVTGAIGGALVKQFKSDEPDTYLSNENQMKAMLVDTFEEDTLGKAGIGGELAAAGLAVPGSGALYKARRGKGFGVARSALGPLGKAASGFATPLGMALTTPLNVASQIRQGDSLEDIATNPLNYLAPAFAGSLTREATRGMNPQGLLAKGLRLGMSPAGVRVISKFFGLPGLALSLGYEGYDQYRKYKEGEGFLYNLLNKDE
jgi:DNA-binding Lrp family transcriptional regulator